jgi:hypothetical protein
VEDLKMKNIQKCVLLWSKQMNVVIFEKTQYGHKNELKGPSAGIFEILKVCSKIKSSLPA